MIMLASMLFESGLQIVFFFCTFFPLLAPSIHANLLILNIFLTFCKRHCAGGGVGELTTNQQQQQREASEKPSNFMIYVVQKL